MSNLTLPTLDRLGVSLPGFLDPVQIATEWLHSFSDNLLAKNYANVLNLLSEDAFIRDLLALSWDLRTFQGTKIKAFLEERVANIHIVPHSFKLTNATLDKPYPDLAWIQGFFTFETDISFNSGIFRLIPTSSTDGIVWKAHTVFTNMEDLKGFPEKIGANRNFMPNHGKWADERAREVAFTNEDPAVLIIGAGQSGLDVAARLKALGVKTLLVESSARVGDQWRNRYEALCLHDPVC
jgi:phosphoglycerate dehydrogenase-like enzyme